MTFRPLYLALAAVIFTIEVAIAQGVIRGEFVRSYLGDLLVIVLIYCVLRGLTRATPLVALALSVGAGVAAELLQSIHLADILGLAPGSLWYVLLGNTFSWLDLVMYVVGGVLSAGLDTAALRQPVALQGGSNE